jgi:PAS domain S-box-containing protein
MPFLCGFEGVKLIYMKKTPLPPSARPCSVDLGQEAIERLAAIVADSNDAIIGKDLGGVITSWNRAAENIFGYSKEEAIGRSIQFLIPSERAEEENFILNKILKGERISHFETQRICKGGRRILVSVTVSPIFDVNGKVVGASKIARDITLQKQAEEALVIANKELAFQNEEKAKRAAELVITNEQLQKSLFETIKVAELVMADEEKAKRAAELVITNERLQKSLFETINIVRRIAELRDPYTAGHEKHVGDLAKAIGAEIGLDTHSQEGLMFAGYLHDIGKIIVPAEILSKPGKLSLEEYSLVKNHVQAGYDLLKDITFPWQITRPILEHHERLDGSGYPNGVKGDQISIEGRILAVADTVDAMASHRPYRVALGIESALAEIVRGRGTLYDEMVVDACLTLFREKNYKILSTAP